MPSLLASEKTEKPARKALHTTWPEEIKAFLCFRHSNKLIMAKLTVEQRAGKPLVLISCIRANRLLFLFSTGICLLDSGANKLFPLFQSSPDDLPCSTCTGSFSKSRLGPELCSSPGTAEHKLSHPVPAPLCPSGATFGCPGGGRATAAVALQSCDTSPPGPKADTLCKELGCAAFLHHLQPHGVLTALLSVCVGNIKGKESFREL